jgi:hypothetical protein
MAKPVLAAVLSLLVATPSFAAEPAAASCGAAEAQPCDPAREPLTAPEPEPMPVARAWREPLVAPDATASAELEATREPLEAPDPTSSSMDAMVMDAPDLEPGDATRVVEALRQVFARSLGDNLATQLDGPYDGTDEELEAGDRHAPQQPESDVDLAWSKMFGAALANIEPDSWSDHDPAVAFLTENIGRLVWTEWMDATAARLELTLADERVSADDIAVPPGAGPVDASSLEPARAEGSNPGLSLIGQAVWLQDAALTWREPCEEFAELLWLKPPTGRADETHEARLDEAPDDDFRLEMTDAIRTNDERPPAPPLFLKYLGQAATPPDRLMLGWVGHPELEPPEQVPVTFLVWLARNEPVPRTWRDRQQEIRCKAVAHDHAFNGFGFPACRISH